MKYFVAIWLVLGVWWVVSTMGTEDTYNVVYTMEAPIEAPSGDGDTKETHGDISEQSYRVSWIDGVLYYIKEITTVGVGVVNLMYLIRRKKK